MNNLLSNSKVDSPEMSTDQLSILDSHKLVSPELKAEFDRRVDELNHFAELLENPLDLQNKYTKLAIISKMSYGFRRATEASAWSAFLLGEAKNRKKSYEAIAMHDNFWEYVEKKEKAGKQVKTTESFVKSYVDIDPDVINARREEAMLQAMHIQFLGLKMEFSQGISTIRTVFDPYAEEKQMTSMSDVGMHSKEGI